MRGGSIGRWGTKRRNAWEADVRAVVATTTSSRSPMTSFRLALQVFTVSSSSRRGW